MRLFLILLLSGFPALAQVAPKISVLERREIAFEPAAARSTHELRLTLVYLDKGRWTPEAVTAAAAESARILAQCGVALTTAQLIRVAAPLQFHDFHTPVSRELAAALSLRKPTLYFVSGTRERPAFDAEAIGRGNSRSRPELEDTVWVTHGTRDLGIAVAHELAHVLMDSGEHSDVPGNLMRDETASDSTRLADAQCARLRDVGSANGLLR